MSLQFIMGPSGSGKSHYLYQWVTEESLKNPDKNYIVIVPEQFTMQTQRDLVVASPRKGILNVDVLSFNRLAYRVFEETGSNHNTILDEIGKCFVLRKVAGNCQQDLRVLGSNVKKVGFIGELKSIISEFTQYDVNADKLEEMIGKLSPTTSFYYKLQDIQKIYAGFQEYLSGKYITGEELLDVLCQAVPASNILKNSVVVLDGFTGFTPVQNKLLQELLLVCEKMMVTVTMDICPRKLSLFDLSDKTVESLTKIAKDCKTTVDSPVKLYEKPAYRFRQNAALAFMEDNLFRYSKKQYIGEQESVQIFEAKNPKEEIDFLAQQIRHLVRVEGMRYRDIAVITSDMASYGNYMKKVFEDYQIPVFMDHKRSILMNSFVEYLRSLLSMAEQNFTYESVFRYLRTDLTEFTKDEVDTLENYCVALGIRGYKEWSVEWIRRTRGMEKEELDKINEIRQRFVSSLESVMSVLKSRSKTVESVTRALHEFLLKNQLQQKVKDYEERFAESGELELEKEYAQVYRIVMELFDQFVELLGDEKLALKEYCELLDAGLEEAKVGIIPPSLEQVVVGDIERTRIKDVKVVFFVGVNDSYIPGGANAKGLLAEREREKFAENGIVLAPGAKEKSFVQKFYLYLIMTKPSEKIILTYSRTRADGESMRPAYLVSELLKLYPELHVQKVQHQLASQELTPKKGISYLIEGLQNRSEGLGQEWKELYTWYKNNPEWSNVVEKLVEAAFYQREGEKLTDVTAEALYGKLLNNSVSRLEKFSACAFAHFLAYGLRIQEREEYQFQSLDLGNVLHRAMEYYAKQLEHEGYTWTSVSEEQQGIMVEKSIEKSIADYANSILYSSVRNEYMITRMKNIMKRSVWALTKQLEKGDFVPKGYEIKYDTGTIKLDGHGVMRLYGVIDRMDVCETEEQVFVKVMDYKTGKRVFDLGEFYHGIQMQLVVYMNAAVKMEQEEKPNKKIVPAAIFYYQMQDPLIKKNEKLLKKLAPNGIVNQSEEVIQHLEKGLEKTSEIMSISRNKDGSISKTSKAILENDFALLSAYAEEKAKEIGKNILGGDISVSPYEMDGRTGCDICKYRGICGFDEKIPGYQYRKLRQMDDMEILEKMREEAQEWESNTPENNSK